MLYICTAPATGKEHVSKAFQNAFSTLSECDTPT